ncbi:hypothetical protein IFM89_021576 [Coptis chinensis]|uniref:MO25-like protein n=1 Tax=Coptis chinensis TaxID=261450 RepID=A0A835LZ09_9MAGN|nr:hypothetical protein IFM89_021576 [Coptis chinensis]
MKGLFKSKPKTPTEIVRLTRELLKFVDLNSFPKEWKRDEKMSELSKYLRELKCILYGSSEAEPVSEACAQLTQEFFSENTLRLIIVCLPRLNLEARKDATQVAANLQHQQVQYENPDMALHYGGMLRECIRHQSIARYVLESENMKKFFDYIQFPNFDIASDVSATFKVLFAA